MRRCWISSAITAALICAGLPSAASAQSSASCSVSDYSIALNLHMPLAKDGSGAAMAGAMRGTLEVHHQKIARDRRRWTLDGRTPTQLWNSGRDFRVRLLLASGDNLMDLIIETEARAGTGAYMGTFRLEASEGVKVQGRIECSVG